jgi:hypothetical protein
LEDFDVTPVSDQVRSYVSDAIPIPVTLSTGDVVLVRPLTGEDEKFIANVNPKDKHKLGTYHLARRIVEIDSKTKWREIVKVVEELPSRLSDELWDLTDDIEGGVETEFAVECNNCDNEMETILPFGESFFSKRRRSVRSEMRVNG